MKSGFEATLRAGRFVITAEISPPLSTDPQHLLQAAMPLAGPADAINVTDGAGARSHRACWPSPAFSFGMASSQSSSSPAAIAIALRYRAI